MNGTLKQDLRNFGGLYDQNTLQMGSKIFQDIMKKIISTGIAPMNNPKLSYTIWFTQRTGSTLLYKAIESTGVAGVPREWFNCPPDLLTTFRKTSHAELQEYLYKLGCTPNGVFGISHSFYEPHFSQLTETLRDFPAAGSAPLERTALW